MKLFRFSVTTALVGLSGLLLGSCSDDEGIDNRDRDYGYVQFKLYKEASYEPVSTASAATKAARPELDYLSEASKLKVTLLCGAETVTQSLTLTYADKETAEFGIRSEKLRLLAGSYRIAAFELYDALEELIYRNAPENDAFDIAAGGLVAHDLTVNVSPRGKVRFTFLKDISGFEGPKSRSVTRQYTLDEIATVDLTVRNNADNKITKIENLKTKFSIHFDEEDRENDAFGYQTSSLTCDSVLWLPAGDYTVRSYKTYDSSKILLEEKSDLDRSTFTITDNALTDAEVDVELYEADEYIQDYYALYQIWLALEGPSWSYKGENYSPGTNWDFNKSPDLWGDQPGVELHSNGRVAKISISDFGFGGRVPKQIGQLTELVELYLGTHSDMNINPGEPAIGKGQSLAELNRNRAKNYSEYLRKIHPVTQLSEPLAFALMEHGITSPGIELYEQYTEKEIIDRKTGRQLIIRPYDTTHGTIGNRLQEISEEIGKLKKLERFSLANSTIDHLPQAMSELESCIEFEVYNCPNMKEFPLQIARMPALITVNLSCNRQWDADQVYMGMKALADAEADKSVKEQPTIQILFCRDNNLREIPESFSNMKKLGRLDMGSNQIEKLHPLGKDILMVELYLDDNLIESIPADEKGYYCGTNELETFSVTYNKLRLVPDIFTAKNVRVMGSIDFSNNQITGFENEGSGYRGMNAKSLALANNPGLTKFPVCLAQTDSQISELNLRGCGIDEVPKDAFTGKYSHFLTVIDLSYNHLQKLPDTFDAASLPYLYGLDVSYNHFDKFPWAPLNCASLTAYSLRGQRDANGKRCLREWPTGLYNHTGLRGFYIGSNDLRKIDDTISYLIYNLDISDNPNITFDASGVCYYWKSGVYNLIYDKTQNITGCDDMLK